MFSSANVIKSAISAIFCLVIIAIMKKCDHSEVIREMLILEPNARQTTFRITQKQTFKL